MRGNKAQRRDAEHSRQPEWSLALSMVTIQDHNPPGLTRSGRFWQTSIHRGEGLAGLRVWGAVLIICACVRERAAEEIIASGLCYSVNTNGMKRWYLDQAYKDVRLSKSNKLQKNCKPNDFGDITLKQTLWLYGHGKDSTVNQYQYNIVILDLLLC